MIFFVFCVYMREACFCVCMHVRMCENAYKQRLDVESHHHSSTLFSEPWPLNQIQSSLIWLVSLASLHCLPRQEIQASSVLVVSVNLTKPRVS